MFFISSIKSCKEIVDKEKNNKWKNLSHTHTYQLENISNSVCVCVCVWLNAFRMHMYDVPQ